MRAAWSRPLENVHRLAQVAAERTSIHRLPVRITLDPHREKITKNQLLNFRK